MAGDGMIVGCSHPNVLPKITVIRAVFGEEPLIRIDGFLCLDCSRIISPDARFTPQGGDRDAVQLGEGNRPAEVDDDLVLGLCAHGVDLDRDFCEHGCRA